MAAVAQLKTGGPKALYEIGEIPPLGHVPEKMYAWAIRRERHGPPEDSMQLEVVPTWSIADDEVLILVMAAGRQLQRSLGRPRRADLALRRAQGAVPRRGSMRPASSGRSAPR
jgi:hypothetical protein